MRLGGKFNLVIGQLPPKSRVETQIRVHIKLQDSLSVPVQTYKSIVLDDDMMVPSTRKKGKGDDNGDVDLAKATSTSFLRIQCRVVTSQETDSEVHRCVACVMRERRTHARRTKGEVQQDESEESLEHDKKKIVVFHSQKVIDFANGDAILPIRITCYCRHHKEQHGFGLAISVFDGFTNELIGAALAGYIMITDDHKSQQRRPAKKPKLQRDESSLPPTRGPPFLTVTIPSHLSDDDSSSASGSTSPMALAAPAVPNYAPHMSFSHSGEPSPQSPPTNPFYELTPQPQPFRLGAPHDYATPNPTAGLLQPPTPSYHGAAVSSPASRSASGSPPLSPSVVSRPSVDRVIPHEGPLSGGLEVTVLGQGLLPVHRCFFGASAAKVAMYWGPTTLVCVLPPATVPGTVPVFILPPTGTSTMHFDEPTADSNAVFTYKDDADKQLLELALQIIGMKMTGRIEDARSVAQEIVRQSSNPSSPQGGSGYNSGGSTTYSKSSSDSKEPLVLKALLSLLQNQLPGANPSYAAASGPFDLAMQNGNGQTLMHLAIQKGYSSLFALLVRVALNQVPGFSFDVNTPDWNGWTPLHAAAATGNEVAAQALLSQCGALAVFNDEVGLLPYEVVDEDKHPKLRELLQNSAKAYEDAVKTAAQIRSATESSSRSTQPLESAVLPASSYIDPDEDIEAAKAANAAASAHSFSLFGADGKNRAASAVDMLIRFMEALNGFWMSYRMGIYIASLLALAGFALLEFLPFNFASGPVARGFELTGSNNGFNPNKTKPADIWANSNLQSGWIPAGRLWNLYFFVRLLAVCGILFGILWHNRERLRARSPVAFVIGIIVILLLFLAGSLYIFDLLPFF